MPVAELRGWLSYNSDSGQITRIRSASSNARAGDLAGSNHGGGYLIVRVAGRRILAHRAAWALHYGAWPASEVDHIDGDGSNNRICNLRLATRSQNCTNTKAKRWKAVPLKGVCESARVNGRKYRATIFVNGRYESLGTFETPSEAHAAYVEAAKMAFGDFANAGVVP